MLILSKAALKYAVDVCIEKETNVIIGVLGSAGCKRVSEILDEIIGHKNKFQKRSADFPYVTYRYKNGSQIDILPAGTSFHNYRCNTLIIQKEILNLPDCADNFLAMQYCGYGEKF